MAEEKHLLSLRPEAVHTLAPLLPALEPPRIARLLTEVVCSLPRRDSAPLERFIPDGREDLLAWVARVLGALDDERTGEIGLVARYPKKSGSPYPGVMLLKRDDLGAFQAGDAVELEPTEPHRGASLRRVARTLNPGAYGIQPADFLLQDLGGR